jgi:hypothetical protein
VPYNGYSDEAQERSCPWLGKRYANGRIKRPTRCQVCGSTRDEGYIHHHAEDYSEPFGPWLYEYALCLRCHYTLHARFKNRSAFDAYAEQIRRGDVLEGVKVNNHNAVWAYCRGNRAYRESLVVRRNPPRESTLLDVIGSGPDDPNVPGPLARSVLHDLFDPLPTDPPGFTFEPAKPSPQRGLF